MITYNHAPYLAQAVESVLGQQTCFPYELVIGEDCSSDETREIAVRFARRFPEAVRLLPSAERLGANRNFERTLAACRGKYVALLEGDDFWTSPHKLERQVQVLETSPEVSLTFHPVHIVPRRGAGEGRVFPKSVPERTGIRDILQYNYIPTPSVVARNPGLSRLPGWFHRTYMTDWPFFLLCASGGQIHFTREPMAAYRMTGEGIWTSISSTEKMKHWLEAYLAADRAFAHQYSDILKPLILRTRFGLALRYQAAGMFAEAKQQMQAYFATAPLLGQWKTKLRLILGVAYPQAWQVLQRLRGRTA